MNETEQIVADSSAKTVAEPVSQDTAPAPQDTAPVPQDAAPVKDSDAASAPQQSGPQLVASDMQDEPANDKDIQKVKQKMKKIREEISLMPLSDASHVEAQLSLPGTDSTMVFDVVETHEGKHAVLYNEYKQSETARNAQNSIEDASGHKVLPIAKAKLGSTYCKNKNDYSTEQGCKGDSEEFGIGSLIEFQATGLIVVMAVIVGLTVLCYLMSFIMAKLGLNKIKAPAPVVKAAAPAAAPKTIGPAHCDWDPNAASVHPGFTNKQLQAFLGIAAVAALEEHPGMSNEQFLALVTAAATQAIGQPCRVTAYRNINSPAWTIVK